MEIKPVKDRDGQPWILVIDGSKTHCLSVKEAQGMSDGIAKAIVAAQDMPPPSGQSGVRAPIQPVQPTKTGTEAIDALVKTA